MFVLSCSFRNRFSFKLAFFFLQIAVNFDPHLPCTIFEKNQEKPPIKLEGMGNFLSKFVSGFFSLRMHGKELSYVCIELNQGLFCHDQVSLGKFFQFVT